eukprot:CAMPEP_0198259698 /NCGR_PEP_ID=MMETSP1447-20131203/8813_1 /TAXON_ID=420782 /ORGANISM="Chaetoceros dichaeta, Strain CCMP1751" /LENGTH=267 /DNA_ID=CAMNT_0043947143 /DNA_START=18 /DNA_END=821 /DNA_ORIENTATION=-
METPHDDETILSSDETDVDSKALKPKKEQKEKEEVKTNKTKKKKKVHKLSLAGTELFTAKLRKRGVVYLSRIPPRMGPAKVKALLAEFGVVTRIYLEEEDKASRKRRQMATGSKGGKRYREGWVEFEDKKVGKHVAESLNSTSISNYKRSVHYGDLWCLKYLSKFRWDHLTEKVAYERRVREQKLRVEMVQARKENQAFSTLVGVGKAMDKIDERRKKRKLKEGSSLGDEKVHQNDHKKRKRKFRQTAPVTQGNVGSAKAPLLGSMI